MALASYRFAGRPMSASFLLSIITTPALAQSSRSPFPVYMPLVNLISYLVLFAFAVIVVLWWRKGRKPTRLALDTAMLDEGFEITRSADEQSTRFAISGSGIGIGAWIGFILGGLFFGTILTVIFAISYKLDDSRSLFTFCLMMAIALGSAFLWDRMRKQQFVFEITNGGVHAPDGQHYAKDSISEILIRNQGATAHSAPAQSTTIIAGTGVAGMAMVGATVMGNASAGVGSAIGQSVAQSIAKRGNEVSIRHGRKVIPLAKYLREDDAIALFNKVQELL